MDYWFRSMKKLRFKNFRDVRYFVCFVFLPEMVH